MQLSCNYHYQLLTNHLPISPTVFITLAIIVAVTTDYSNLMYQCFTSHYKSDLVIYITNLPMITNTSLAIIALVISSPLVANVLPITNLPMVIENLPIAANGLPMVPIIGNNMQHVTKTELVIFKPKCKKLDF